ncbi:MAG: MAPEG family protein [Parvibaculaceae bacterium]|nr:MAPEG family protein [Parvibaculaceae bacterium]
MSVHLVSLVTVVSLLVFVWMFLRVGRAREAFGVAAPATTGHAVFERHFRVQMNTLEGLIIYLPSLWLFGFYVDNRLAAALGVLWVIGRVIYAVSYVKEPSSRSLGFGIQGLATAVLLLGALVGIIRAISITGI